MSSSEAPPISAVVDVGLSPFSLLDAWPDDVPLACLLSGGTGTWSRWSLFAIPSSREQVDTGNPFPSLRTLAARQTLPLLRPGSPFGPGWFGWVSYDAGREIEPAACAAASAACSSVPDRSWPIAEFVRCPAVLVHDAFSGMWTLSGDGSDAQQLVSACEQAVSRIRERLRFRVGRLRSDTGRRRFELAVARAVDYIRAGDVFQVNLAHRLSAAFDGSPRSFASRFLAEASPWFGAYFESGPRPGVIDRAIISASPELFLTFDPLSRRLVTRPMKGTRPGSPRAGTELARSEKDQAELTMITDLMRNDLGRVCRFGSIRVDDARTIERHGLSIGAENATTSTGVYQGVATVSGALREGLTPIDALEAAFPPGSVTGAPKVRAMQIIDELEPVRRGPYCGCIGYISDSGHACFNVAIRTACLQFTEQSTASHTARGVLDYSVGAGIVADSVPRREWAETLVKAGVLRAAAVSAPPLRTRPAPRMLMPEPHP